MSSVPVTRNWNVFVDDIEKHYLSIDFTKTHPSPYADTFTIVLAGQQTDVEHFDVVEIKKDNVLRFYGYVEKIEYNSELDTIISGRCRKLILWKKFTERFIESRKEMAGFFGHVDGGELFKFLLRCPVSDFPTEDEETWDEYPRHKVGWGMNSRGWDVRTNATTEGTHATYAILRLMGFYWRNRGTDSAADILLPDGGAAGSWTDSGGGGCSGAGCLDDCSDDAEYIWSGTNGDVTGNYTFDDLAGTATGINSVKLRLRLKRTGGWWGRVTVRTEVYNGTQWLTAGYVIFDYSSNPVYVTFDVSWILDTVAKVNGALVRLTRWSGVEMGVHANIYCIELIVDYSDSGSQEVGDYFEIDFNESKTRVCGILIQSRHSDDQFPADYCIDKFIESGDEDFTTYTPVDVAADRITGVTATHIDHDQYRNETTYTYKDYTAGYFTDFTHKFQFRTQASIPKDGGNAGPAPPLYPVFTPYCLANRNDHDLYWLDDNNEDFITVYVAKPRTGVPVIVLAARNGGSMTVDYSAIISGNTWYYCTVTKTGREIICEIRDENGDYIDTLNVTVPTADISLRYIFAGITWNNPYTGTATANGAVGGTTVIDTNRTEPNDAWNDCVMEITSGPSSGEVRPIDDWVNGTGTFTIGGGGFSNQITTGTTYEIYLNCDGDIEYFSLGDWSELACGTDHTCQDILHSWQPTSMDKIRIQITVQDASHSWEISQIYVYQSDEYRFCVVEET